MLEQTIVVGPFQCNCRLLACPETGRAVVVDPGDEPEEIIRALEKLRTAKGDPIRVEYLLHTHAHLDHIGATRKVKEMSKASGTPDAPALIAVHRDDAPLYSQLRMQGSLFGMDFEDPLPIDHLLEDGEEIIVGTLKLTVIHTPGHSPGGVCFRLHEDRAHGVSETLLSGDTLFQGSVGRTDLWGGDQDLLFSSVRRRIFTLDDDTRVCPGHGPDTQVGIEKRTNPFFG